MSTTSASFSTTQNTTAPPPQVVTLTAINGTVYVATSQTGSGFNHSLQAPGAATGTITITPDFPTVAGNLTGTITVRGCPDQACTTDVAGSPKVITVSYAVAPAPTLTTTPTTVDFVTTVGKTPASKSVDLNLSTGSAVWTATVFPFSAGTPNFLTVTPATGSALPQTLTLDVASVPPAGTYRANVVLTAAGLTRIVPVSLTVRAPVVNFVSPYVETTNVPGSVIIRGFGFSNLASGSLQVLFGASPATSATVVSDTEIQAVHPPLLAGSYPITVKDSSQIIPSRAGLQLFVTNPPNFPAVTVTRLGFFPGPAVNLIYDGERRALYLMDSQNKNVIERYQFAAGWSGTSITTGTGGGNSRITLSPDGKLLIETAGLGTDISLIDVPTFAPLPSVSAAALLGSDAHLNLVAFGNDGGAIGNAYSPTSGITLYRYDMLSQVFTALSTQPDMTNRAIVASADGDTLVMPSFEPLDPTFAKPVFTYDASDGSLVQRLPVTSTGTDHASVSRNGSRVILVNSPSSPTQVTTVYDVSPTAFTPRGTLPAGLNAFVISPDGATAYAYFRSSNSIRKFNLNAPAGSGFQEIGSGTTVATPDDGSSPGLPNDFFAAMTMTQDGGTIFLAGSQRILVLPAP